VLDDYNRNVTLVDLSAQPDEYKIMIESTIKTNATTQSRSMIGAQFLKFCGKYDLVKLSDNAANMAEWMSASYPTTAIALFHLVDD
jgi:hypothetical protein